MALFSNLYALKLQRLEKMLRQTRGAKSARMAKLWQFRQGHPKPAFSEKVQRRDQEKFFTDRPKNSPQLKKANSTLAEMALSSNNYAVKVQLKTGENCGAKKSSKSARKTKLWQFLKGHPKHAFSKKVQRGHQGNF